MPHDTQSVVLGPLRYNPDSVIRHTTVCQILKADRVHSTALFTIEGNEFKKIILLGNLHLRQCANSYTDFNLDDGTGRILVRLWDRHNDMNLSWLDFGASPYARVIGEVDNWNNSNYVTATKIELTSSPYEPYHHILQAIHDTIAYERGSHGYQHAIPNNIPGPFDSTPPSPFAPTQTLNFGESEREITDNSWTLSSIWKGKGKARSDDPPLHPEYHESSREICHSFSYVEDTLGDTRMQSSPLSSPPSSPLVLPCLQKSDIHDLYSRLPSLDRDILNCIASTKETNSGRQDPWKGVYLPIIVAAVSSSRTKALTAAEFTASLERLIDEGFIFSSIDDDHYDITLSPAGSDLL